MTTCKKAISNELKRLDNHLKKRYGCSLKMEESAYDSRSEMWFLVINNDTLSYNMHVVATTVMKYLKVKDIAINGKVYHTK